MSKTKKEFLGLRPKRRKGRKPDAADEYAAKSVPEGPYCADWPVCPFHTYRKMSKKEFRRFRETRPTPSWSRRERMEYCALLRDFLSIQDGVKDCGINDDWPEEKPESGGEKK